jgi:hypothetical protein
VSVLPYTSCAPSSRTPLSGADGKPIPSWGTIKKSLTFGLRTFLCTFMLAVVSKPILGINFLAANRLLVDPSSRFWTQTHFTLCQNPPCHRRRHDSPLHFATSLWPSVVSLPPSRQSSGMALEHQIRNTKSNTPRHVALIWTSCTTQKLSSEPWRKQDSAPFKLSPGRRCSTWSLEPDGSWRPWGYYWRLNLATVHDRYPPALIAGFVIQTSWMQIFFCHRLGKGLPPRSNGSGGMKKKD